MDKKNEPHPCEGRCSSRYWKQRRERNFQMLEAGAVLVVNTRGIKDPYANAHRIQVEEEKPVAKRGTYLHPEVWTRVEIASKE